jgi:hypothetical protein
MGIIYVTASAAVYGKGAAGMRKMPIGIQTFEDIITDGYSPFAQDRRVPARQSFGAVPFQAFSSVPETSDALVMNDAPLSKSY